MILFFEFRNNGWRAAGIDAKGEKWISGGGSARGEFMALDSARRAFGLTAKKAPSCVAVARYTGSSHAADVSWSTVRAGIAMANTLAFAWGVPAVAVELTENETAAETAKKVRSAAKKAVKGRWVAAAYSGEPTITKAKG